MIRADFKRYLMGLLKLKHPHLDPFTKEPSMKEALTCKECGERVLKAEQIYKRTRTEHPEWFEYKEPEHKRSEALEKEYDLLTERKEKDPLYKRHIERLTNGTEAEKDEEIKKANEGYYQKHYVDEGGSLKEVNNDKPRRTNP